MTKIENVPCTCGGSSLLMLTDEGFHAVWCSCGNVKKNQILQRLRSEGWDIGACYFQKKAKKEDQPPVNDRILGKFKDTAALKKALYSLADHMEIPREVVDEKVKTLGTVTAYRRLLASFSSRKVKA